MTRQARPADSERGAPIIIAARQTTRSCPRHWKGLVKTRLKDAPRDYHAAHLTYPALTRRFPVFRTRPGTQVAYDAPVRLPTRDRPSPTSANGRRVARSADPMFRRPAILFPVTGDVGYYTKSGRFPPAQSAWLRRRGPPNPASFDPRYIAGGRLSKASSVSVPVRRVSLKC